MTPAWTKCRECDDWFCNIHRRHLGECRCPDLDTMLAKGMDPYVDRPDFPTYSIELSPFSFSAYFYEELQVNARVASMVIPSLLRDQFGLPSIRHKSGNCVRIHEDHYKVRAVVRHLSFGPSCSTGVGRHLDQANWDRGLEKIDGFAIYEIGIADPYFHVKLVPLKNVLEAISKVKRTYLTPDDARMFGFIY